MRRVLPGERTAPLSSTYNSACLRDISLLTIRMSQLWSLQAARAAGTGKLSPGRALPTVQVAKRPSGRALSDVRSLRLLSAQDERPVRQLESAAVTRCSRRTNARFPLRTCR